MTMTATSARRDPLPFDVLTAAALALLAMTLFWAAFDPRLIGGVPVWTKPAKFALSLAVHFGTLALILRAMSPAARNARAVQVAALVMSAAFVTEMSYMIYQAAQAQASHYNLGSLFHALMYAMMGVGAVLLIAAPLVVARAALRDGASAMGPATRAGIWWGAWTSFGMTLLVAGTMSAGTGPYIGLPADGAASIPFLGWSGTAGDLRPAHFLALHALQALPLAGLWLDRRGRSPGIMPVLAAGWALVTLVLFGQALMGLPLIRL